MSNTDSGKHPFRQRGRQDSHLAKTDNRPAHRRIGKAAMFLGGSMRSGINGAAWSVAATAAIAIALAAVRPPAADAARCGVSAGKLWCSNRVSPIYDKPSTNLPPSTQIDTLRSRYSYFLCWSSGQYHQGGNYTWYKTVGDDRSRTGWVPAYKLDTSSAFDSDPSRHGLRACQYDWG